jgi:hypothetical protein
MTPLSFSPLPGNPTMIICPIMAARWDVSQDVGDADIGAACGPDPARHNAAPAVSTAMSQERWREDGDIWPEGLGTNFAPIVDRLGGP